MLNKDAVREGRSFINRYTGAEPAEKPASQRPHSKAFEAARPFSQEGLMVEVCFRSGRCRFFDSAGCVEAAYEKGDTVLILYATAVLQIEGRNLGDLASLIKERRVDYVQEQHDEYAAEEEPHIDAILLHHPDRWDELVEELQRSGRITPKQKERKQGHA